MNANNTNQPNGDGWINVATLTAVLAKAAASYEEQQQMIQGNVQTMNLNNKHHALVDFIT